MTDHYQAFVDRWTHPDYRPAPSAPEALDDTQRQLGTELPSGLREFLLRFGPVSTTSELLDLIVDQELDLADLSEFYRPEAIVSETFVWRANGLPSTHVAFACDCQGNLFCFKVGDRAQNMWFFDHEFGTTESLGLGFPQWVSRYATLRT